MISECRRHQSPEEVARDVAGNVGGEGAGGILGAAVLGEIGEGQGERGGHEHTLDDAQDGKDGQTGCHRQQRGRDREQRQAKQYALAPIDVAAQQRHCQTGNRHPHCAGIDSKAHCRWAYAISRGQRRQDRLRREQIGDRQKGRQTDDEGAKERSAGLAPRR